MPVKAPLHSSYPIGSVILYNVTTILHYVLGGAAIVHAYRSSPVAAWVSGVTYLLLALVQMYVVMPLVVCPACVYHRLEGSRCISGLAAVSRLVAPSRPVRTFGRRADGVFCPNNLYLVALLLPIVALIPPLVIARTNTLLVFLGTLLVLLLFRFFVLFPRIACLHCRAKFVCPQAAAMGVREV